MSRSFIFVVACLFAAATEACRSHASSGSPTPVVDSAVGSAALTQKALDWWAAYVAGDSSYFNRFLAEDFVSRQSTVESGGASYREQFLHDYSMSMPCGDAFF